MQCIPLSPSLFHGLFWGNFPSEVVGTRSAFSLGRTYEGNEMKNRTTEKWMAAAFAIAVVSLDMTAGAAETTTKSPHRLNFRVTVEPSPIPASASLTEELDPAKPSKDFLRETPEKGVQLEPEKGN